MARAHHADHYLDAEGRPIVGAAVYLYDQGTTDVIGETIYTEDDTEGSTTTTNPITTDSSGKFEFFLADEVRLDLKFVSTGKQDVTRTVDVLKPGAAGGASAIDDLTDVTITAAASGDFLRHNGTAWVDATLAEGDIPATIARDSEVTTAVSDHSADTTSVHGISDTSTLLNTTTGIAKAIVDAKGDIIAATAADTVSRLAAGTDGQVLKANSATATGLEWDDESGGGGSAATDAIFDAKGDLAVGTGADTADNLPVGANDTILMADSGQATGLKWAAAATTTEIADTAGTESAGTSDTYARGDHVHKLHTHNPTFQTFVGCRAYLNAATQTLATSGTGYAVAFDAESYDTNSFHDNVTNNTRLTIPAGMGGYYLMFANATFAANSTGGRQCFWRVNGTTIISNSIVINAATQSSVVNSQAAYSLAAGDYVELIVAQYSGGSLDLTGGSVFATSGAIQFMGV